MTLVALLPVQLPANSLRKAAEAGTSGWDPANHMGNHIDEALDS